MAVSLPDFKKVRLVGINHQSLVSGEGLEGANSLFPDPVEVITSDSVKPDLVICVDVNDISYREVLKWRMQGVRTVLIASEPRVVVPANYSEQTSNAFEKVIEVGRPMTSPVLPWPQHPFTQPAKRSKSTSEKAILIQSRKYSFVKGQLYGLRVQLASKDKRVYVVGHAWDENLLRTIGRLLIDFFRAVKSKAPLDLSTFITGFKKPLNLIGPAESKVAAMSEFKVAVVIENSQEYMSEKFFDALVGGCIPVYVGADLGAFGIPPELYVKAEANLDSVQLAITKALSLDYESWQTRAQTFLTEAETHQRWESTNALKRILATAFTESE